MMKPWYLIAGNHDHFGDVSAQIAYTQKSKRWAFPNYYYAIKYELANGIKIDIFTLDTILLCGNTLEGKYKDFVEYLAAEASHRKTQGPDDPEAAEKQWHWLEDQLKNSKANYIFVAGHYPIYSTAEHGPTPCLVNRLRSLLQKYKVSAYFSGHDHSLQETDESGWTIHYVLSGAGAYEIHSDKSFHLVPPDSSKFFYPYPHSWKEVAAMVGLGDGGFVYADVGEKEAIFSYMISKVPMEEAHIFRVGPRQL